MGPFQKTQGHHKGQMERWEPIKANNNQETQGSMKYKRLKEEQNRRGCGCI